MTQQQNLSIFGKENDGGINNKYVLKSSVQKCVRMGLTEQGVRLAKRWLEVDATDALRRIPIIMMEDAVLHFNLPHIMGAYTRYMASKQMPKTDVDLILSTVADLCNAEKRDVWFQYENDEPISPEAFSYLSDEEKSLVTALSARANYGGMKIDIKMLGVMANKWLSRFANNEFKMSDFGDIFPAEIINSEDVGQATIDDIPNRAIDAHCSYIVPVLLKKPDIVRKAEELFPYLQPKQSIGEMMWTVFSAPNNKKDLNTGQTYDWLNPQETCVPILKNKQEMCDNMRELGDFSREKVESFQEWFKAKKVE